MRRRLFQSLQQCIESGSREHVNFIDDIYFVFAGSRRIFCALSQLANVINTVIRRTVNLDYIH